MTALENESLVGRGHSNRSPAMRPGFTQSPSGKLVMQIQAKELLLMTLKILMS